jgi:hypothetical protein
MTRLGSVLTPEQLVALACGLIDAEERATQRLPKLKRKDRFRGPANVHTSTANGPDLGWLPVSTASIYLGAADRCLAALAALIESGNAHVACYPVLRAEIEHSARALWVLAPGVFEDGEFVAVEPSTVERTAVARACLQRLRDLWNAGMIEEGQRFWEGQVQPEFGGVELPEQGVDPVRSESWALDGQRYLGDTRLVEWLAHSVFDGDIGADLYRALSSVSHPSTVALAKQSGQTRDLRRLWTIGHDELTTLIQLACVVVYKLTHTLCDYVAVPNSERVALETWADQASDFFEAEQVGGMG